MLRTQVARHSFPPASSTARLDCGYRIDLIVENMLIVELKTVERILPVHEAQLLTYLRLSNLTAGLILNFYAPVLKDGIRRMVLGHP